MSCYHPIKAFRTADGVVFDEKRRHDILGSIELPCGRCIGCRMRRASDWALRVMHEAQMHPVNCFVTLTYAPSKLPPGGSLCHEDFQKFMRRLRKSRESRLRFFMCGEYGEEKGRPHYHACLFNVWFADRVPAGKSGSGAPMFESAELEKLWSHGRCTVQELVPESASYCARYIMKKALGRNSEFAYSTVDADGVLSLLKPEYAAMSLKPGIGAAWFDKYSRDVFPHDVCVTPDGKERQVPKYYDKLAWRKRMAHVDDVEFAREKAARAHASDNTEARRIVREEVHLARVSSLKRGL